MKFFFDARYIRTDFHDGISRYTHELALALAEVVVQRVAPGGAAPAFEEISDFSKEGADQTTGPANSELIFIISNEKQKDFLPPNAKTVKIHPVTSWKEPFTALALNKFNPDVVATPLQSMGSFGRKFKLILNQQDMTYYQHPTPPKNFPWYVRLTWRAYHLTYFPGRWTLNAADIVATVSETSKREIEKAELTKRPIIVVPNAARDLSHFLNAPTKQASNAPKNLVFMGSLLPHKNVLTLVKMMHFLPGRTLHLLSRGSPDYVAKLKAEIPRNTAVVKFYGGVSDEDYANILADNAIMVSASKSEGFGLPLAEALQLGVPCVVSDIAPFHEVAGEGALFADVNSPQDFAEKIQSLDKKATRESLINTGKNHISSFSWQNSAKTLLNAAENLNKK